MFTSLLFLCLEKACTHSSMMELKSVWSQLYLNVQNFGKCLSFVSEVLSQRCHVQSEYMLMSDLGEVLKFHWNRVDFQKTAGHYWKDIFGRHKKFESRKFVKFHRNFLIKLAKNILFWFALDIFHNFINYTLFSSDWSVFSRSLGTSTERGYI
jgi:hypothetical protein